MNNLGPFTWGDYNYDNGYGWAAKVEKPPLCLHPEWLKTIAVMATMWAAAMWPDWVDEYLGMLHVRGDAWAGTEVERHGDIFVRVDLDVYVWDDPDDGGGA